MNIFQVYTQAGGMEGCPITHEPSGNFLQIFFQSLPFLGRTISIYAKVQTIKKITQKELYNIHIITFLYPSQILKLFMKTYQII